ncbi:hypothetical protein SM0020_34645 [Sinorhizobium meliloti CCNWSX0020]|uniref:Uncharacterized protein n=1 Tax=Sinorhizobium meliloti CCNWSX0020 TaxID=1107881 RepID=H0GBK4_RHIML|nr:hypothetical protein SM0020_34645 [Sinorhizobium meliloti CCNWSX0020]
MGSVAVFHDAFFWYTPHDRRVGCKTADAITAAHIGILHEGQKTTYQQDG